MHTAEPEQSNLETDEQQPCSIRSGASARSATLRLDALAIPVVLFLFLVSCVLMVALRATHGRFVYAIDDAYIHMAIAKNLSAHGVFGVTSHEFTSASSSIVWPFLLAAIFKLFGPITIAAFAAQFVIGIALLWLSWDTLKKAGVTSNIYAACVLCCLVVVLPMPAMTFVAMEHLLHAFATLLLATVAVNNLYDDSRPIVFPVLLCAAAVSLVRYEGAFLVAAVALLFLLEKRLFDAFAIAAAGATPIVLFGLYSISRGGFFLPNSLLIKKHPTGIDTLLRIRQIASDCPEVFVLAVAALLLLGFGTTGRKSSALLKLFLLAALLHDMLAAYGWFYRYEAYLVALGLIAVAVAAYGSSGILPARRVWAIAALVALAIPLVTRGVGSIIATPLAIKDIYRQQIQMAEFFRVYYPAGRIALNDIGAVTFFADPYCTDLVGLGNTEITRARGFDHSFGGNPGYLFRENNAAQAVLQKNNIEVAAVYDEWFGFQGNSAPPGWIKVGVWVVPDKTILGGAVVSFYGVGFDNAVRLRNNLSEFHRRLPQEVAEYATP